MIDRQVLDELDTLNIAGQPALAAQLVHMFLDQTPSKIAKLETLVTLGLMKNIEIEAHTLKSSSAYMGALTLSQIFKLMESYAKKNKQESLGKILIHLATEYDKVRTELLSIVEGTS